jgi:hypothetical protein
MEIIKQDEFISNALSVDVIVAQQKMLKDVMAKVMKKDVHYGVIPGCGKPSLWKPGAELLCLTFRLSPSFESTNTIDGKHLTVLSKCTLTHIPSGKVFGSAEAICSTKEKKYRLRKESGKIVENANLEDQWNTVLKMANKRALVAAMLIVTGSSDLLTQDMGEDEEPVAVVETEAEVKEIVQKAEEKKEAATGDKETDSLKWVGKIGDMDEIKLESGAPAWILNGVDGTLFKTSIKKHVESTDLNGTFEFTYHKSKKGSNVIDSVKAVTV